MREKTIHIQNLVRELAYLRENLLEDVKKSVVKKHEIDTHYSSVETLFNNSYVVTFYPASDLPASCGAIRSMSVVDDMPMVSLVIPTASDEPEELTVPIDNVIETEKLARFIDQFS